MKKILKWLIILIILMIILICTVYYVFINWFAKDLLESQLENVMKRDVEIQQITLNILSTSPEIIIKDLVIADELLNQSNKLNKSTTIAKKNRFVYIKTLTCLIKLLPLMDRKIELSQLVIKEPYVKVIQHQNGTFNFSDLLKKTENKKTQSNKPKTQLQPDETKLDESKPKQKSTKSKPDVFSADDLPFHIIIGKVGIENAHIHFYDEKYSQAILFNKTNIFLHDTNINPKNLEKENTANLYISMNIKNEGKLNRRWAKTFDFNILLKAAILPFNAQSRLLDPQATIKIDSPSGVVSGLQIYESIRSIFMNYEIKAFDILKKDLRWKNGVFKIKANQQIVNFTEGTLHMDKLIVSTDGKYNISKKICNIVADILLDSNEQKKIKTAIRSFIAKKINNGASKYFFSDKISQNIIDSLTSKDGQMHLIYAVSGPVVKPEVTLVHPKISLLDDFISKALNSIKDNITNSLNQKANTELNKLKQKTESELDKFKDKHLNQKEKDELDILKYNLLKKLPF